MPDKLSRITELIVKNIRRELTPDGREELNLWADESAENRAFLEGHSSMESIASDLAILMQKDDAAIRRKIAALTGERESIPMRRRKEWAYMAAAGIFGLAALGGWLLLNHRPGHQTVTPQVIVSANQDVAPGSDKAILTLNNGKTIILDSAGNGNLATEGTTSITKAGGELNYSPGGFANNAALPVAFNTLSTPKAGQFRLVLPDGTKVWINNASSIQYPVVFSGSERLVTLTGEAYFEVTKNPAMPFIVKIGAPAGVQGEVRVTGTHFNILAYTDEKAVKTSLLEGGVQYSVKGKNVHLLPGQQSNYEAGGQLNVLKNVDMTGEIAWTKGYFHFNQSSLGTVMRQLSRWYDITVKYEGNVEGREFDGDIQRNLNLSQVLDLLANQHVHFTFNGKEITVKP